MPAIPYGSRGRGAVNFRGSFVGR